jgi:hypothetical protein
MLYSRYYPCIFPEGEEEENSNTSVMIAGVPDEIRTQHLRNGSLERYRYALLLSVRVKAEDAMQEEE